MSVKAAEEVSLGFEALGAILESMVIVASCSLICRDSTHRSAMVITSARSVMR